jgi:N-acetylneuraminate synthase
MHKALGGSKKILREEQPTINFAYACVVSIREIKKGEKLSMSNIWVKRPGTGQIKAVNFKKILGSIARRDIHVNSQIKWSDIK